MRVLSDYELKDRENIKLMIEESVRQTLKQLHEAGVKSNFTDLHIHVNYAMGGGAKIVFGDNTEER